MPIHTDGRGNVTYRAPIRNTGDVRPADGPPAIRDNGYGHQQQPDEDPIAPWLEGGFGNIAPPRAQLGALEEPQLAGLDRRPGAGVEAPQPGAGVDPGIFAAAQRYRELDGGASQGDRQDALANYANVLGANRQAAFLAGVRGEAPQPQGVNSFNAPGSDVAANFNSRIDQENEARNIEAREAHRMNQLKANAMRQRSSYQGHPGDFAKAEVLERAANALPNAGELRNTQSNEDRVQFYLDKLRSDSQRGGGGNSNGFVG
jgi:hypothetical protein